MRAGLLLLSLTHDPSRNLRGLLARLRSTSRTSWSSDLLILALLLELEAIHVPDVLVLSVPDHLDRTTTTLLVVVLTNDTATVADGRIAIGRHADDPLSHFQIE